jgi:hypothetical protein
MGCRGELGEGLEKRGKGGKGERVTVKPHRKVGVEPSSVNDAIAPL